MLADGSVCALLHRCGQLRQLELRGLLYNADAAVARVADTCRWGSTLNRVIFCGMCSASSECLVWRTHAGTGSTLLCNVLAQSSLHSRLAPMLQLLSACEEVAYTMLDPASYVMLSSLAAARRHLTSLDLRHCSTLSGGLRLW